MYIVPRAGQPPGSRDGHYRVHDQPSSFRPQRQPRSLLFNWITQVGFEIEGLVLVVLIVEAMFSQDGGRASTPAPRSSYRLRRSGAVRDPFLGHATIKTVLRYLSFVFIVVFVVMAILVLPHVHWTGLPDRHHAGGSGRPPWC